MGGKQLMLPSEIVKKSNALARARWTPDSIWEPRLVAWLASKIHTTDKDFQTYQIRIVDLLGKEPGGKDYKELEQAVIKSMSRVIIIKDKNTSSMYNLFSKCKIDRKKGTIELCFHPDLKEHYLQLGAFFTKYNLFEFMCLPSTYSQRLFEFLKSWDDKKEITVLLSDLHEMLDTPKSFKANFAEFKRKVLERAKKDISKYTSLDFQWEAIKRGRAVYEIKFTFPKKRKQQISATTQAASLLKNALGIEPPQNNEPPKNCMHNSFHEFKKKFADTANKWFDVWQIWSALYSTGNAPLAKDVPENNRLDLMDFLTEWQKTHPGQNGGA